MIFLTLTIAWIIFFGVVLQENKLRQQGKRLPAISHFFRGIATGTMVPLYIYNLITNGNINNGAATVLAFAALLLHGYMIPKLHRAGDSSGLRKATIGMWVLAVVSFLVQLVHLIIMVIIPMLAGSGY